MRAKKLKKGQQTLEVKKPLEGHVTTVITDNVTKFLCPFCLHPDYYFRFQVTLKSGKVSGKYLCPECGKTMRRESLTKNMLPEEYAEWVYEYSGFGFWQKINFKQWNERLYQLGISRPFWDKYKSLKGEKVYADDEDYRDYLSSQESEGGDNG
jgi:predicted RNA-binding Zn-ribbon protein involved in translation (DUF1610 family)